MERKRDREGGFRPLSRRSNVPHGDREMPAAGTQPPMQFYQVYGNWQSYPYQPLQEVMQHEAMRNFMHRGMVESRGTEPAHLGHWNFNSQSAFHGQLDRREQVAHLDLSLNLAVPRPMAAAQQIDSPFHSYARIQGHNPSFNQQTLPHQGLQLFPLPQQGLQGASPSSAGQDGFVHPELVAGVQDGSRNGAIVGKSSAGMQTEPLVGKAIEQPWRPLLPTYQPKGSQGESRQLPPATQLNLQSHEPRSLHQQLETERKKKVSKRSPTQEMRALLRLFNAIFTQDTLVGRDLNRYTEGQIKRYLERLGFSVGTFPITTWGCPGGQYQGLACVLSWILSAVHSKKGYVIVVSEEQAEKAVPYRPGSPYVADTAVLLEMGMLEYKWPFPFSWSILTELRSVYDYKGRESSASKNGQVKEEDVMRVLHTFFPSMTGFGAVMTGHFVVSEDPHVVEKAPVASVDAPPSRECEFLESTIDGHGEEACEVVLEVSCDSVKTEGGCSGKSKATGDTAEPQPCSVEAGVTEDNAPCTVGKVLEVTLPSSCAVQGADNIAEALAGEDSAADTSAGTVGKIAPSMVPSVTPLAPAG
uniref:Uncharacterized protein n=1 Tax=Picocystis salinarum TaxID=88271 RepID=A0A7S3XEL3_9CHLO